MPVGFSAVAAIKAVEYLFVFFKIFLKIVNGNEFRLINKKVFS